MCDGTPGKLQQAMGVKAHKTREEGNIHLSKLGIKGVILRVYTTLILLWGVAT